MPLTLFKLDKSVGGFPTEIPTITASFTVTGYFVLLVLKNSIPEKPLSMMRKFLVVTKPIYYPRNPLYWFFQRR
jgi:hypothetical protein